MHFPCGVKFAHYSLAQIMSAWITASLWPVDCSSLDEPGSDAQVICFGAQVGRFRVYLRKFTGQWALKLRDREKN